MSPLSSDYMYIIGNLETHKYTFTHKKQIIDEYIHCIILERLQEFDGYVPRKIKVQQIHNLNEYFTNPDYNDFTERVLNTDDLTAVINYRNGY
ncbi:uncharacterized protein CHSO_3251 [Chryseobacterium sp. StRB126]|uniref:hypothetical protein n=1 Tax=Chryseobacterium sp. StRB126 TaxID=878220 RepID=UPI0004E99594|nr:hypothetical protein [Chryseobacterium sp. StRB126]BAP32288.1 uncharacterized protein CHSO_3251 [Chryseobacterium sp. StRB126]